MENWVLKLYLSEDFRPERNLWGVKIFMTLGCENLHEKHNRKSEKLKSKQSLILSSCLGYHGLSGILIFYDVVFSSLNKVV